MDIVNIFLARRPRGLDLKPYKPCSRGRKTLTWQASPDKCPIKMCGISGILGLDPGKNIDAALLARMTDAIAHRGPDDEGYVLFTGTGGECGQFSGKASSTEVKNLYPELDLARKARLGLGFRRLAIIETGVAGHQPMRDKELELCIVFNGEIYNYIELRADLQSAGYVFSSHSDTEVILKAYHAWGENCLQRFNGIWAFALWDEKRQRLFCSRDRFGVKPFYYCVHDRTLYFGSELKQLLLTPVSKTLNTRMIWRSLKINSLQVYGSETYWQRISALEAGHTLIAQDGKISLKRYHDLDPRTFGTSRITFGEAVENYRSLFQRAVKWQMRSDVEIGSCLSGGLDSSAIVCTASKLTDRPLQTFSSYFEELPALDERKWIAEVAKSCGCNSHLTSPGVEDSLRWFKEATWHNDLPVGAGFAAQYGVMKLAQETGIKVLLDGQGSDELTAGYRHAQYRWLADLLLQGNLKKLSGELKSYLQQNSLPTGLGGTGKSLLSAVLSEPQLYALEFRQLRFDPFNADFIRKCRIAGGEGILSRIVSTPGGKLASFLYNQVYTTSLPTLLHWEDRMSMAASLESRVPFLDHELVEFAFSLPEEFKINEARGKYVHRQAMKDIVPAAIYARKNKAIFGSPFHKIWMRKGMKRALETLFASQGFRHRGIWDLPRINAQWCKYLKGDDSQAEMLFNVFSLETWFRVCGSS